MIVDKLKNSSFYYALNDKFEKAFKFLEENNLEEMECGRYEIDGNNLFISIMEYNTVSEDKCLWEAHKKYIDIQYIIHGSEKMGYTNVHNINITKSYDENKDILFGEGRGSFINVSKGEFVIFTPNDGHMPNINIDNSQYVKKAVVKILI